MNHAKAFHTYKTMQMIFSLHDMHDKAAMWKQHTRTKEINIFKPSPCKALKNALLFIFLLKEDQLCLSFSSLFPPLGLPTNYFRQQFHRVEHHSKYSSSDQLRSGWQMKTCSHLIQRLLTVHLFNAAGVFVFL